MRPTRPPVKPSPLSPRDSRQTSASSSMSGRQSGQPGHSYQGRHAQKPSINVSGEPSKPSSPLAASTQLSSSTFSRNGSQSPTQPTSAMSHPSALSNPSALRHMASAEQESPGPTALLIPTDRPLEDLEQWLPGMSRLRVDREVVLNGYTLYGIRSWYLSRTHGAYTIAASTGKPSDKIHCYLLVPKDDHSQQEGQAQVDQVARLISKQTGAHPRKTTYGTLLVSTPTLHGQEVWPIPGGDMREVWPFIVLNTALRRLGCGGRAAMGSEPPVPAIRRNFYEQYRIPNGPNNAITAAPSRAGSPPQSPTSLRGHNNNWFNSQNGRPTLDGQSETNLLSSSTNSQINVEALLADPIMLNVVELVKLIQGALAIWGLWGGYTDSNKDGDLEPDGLFCDETKVAIFEWRKLMGMEDDDNYRIERETSGGVVDPKTLAALLSSITSTRYLLAALECDKLPKDPFTNIRRFLSAWRTFQSSAMGLQQPSNHLTVTGLRQLNSVYVDCRKSHPTDALKVHRFFISGVTAATSSLSANLKGNVSEDTPTPLRKREKHMKFAEEGDSGFDMIVPEAGVGIVAGPDVITSDLEAYVKGVLKSRERDWDIIGARRVAELWNGHIAEGNGHAHHHRGKFFRRRRAKEDQEDEGVGAAAIGAFKGMTKGVQNRTAKTGQAVKGALGMSAGKARGDTSDSEAERRQQQYNNKGIGLNIPTVVGPTPDTETLSNMSRSVSPAVIPASQSRGNLRVDGVGLGRPPTHSPHNTFMSNLSGEYSDEPSFRGSHGLSKSFSNGSMHHQPFTFGTSPRSHSSGRGIDSPMRRPRNLTVSLGSVARNNTERYPGYGSSQPNRRPPPMTRTASDSAGNHDSGAEWPPSTSAGPRKPIPDFLQPAEAPAEPPKPPEPRRRHSFSDKSGFRETVLKPAYDLAIDVEVCETVWKFMEREKALRAAADAMAQMERSAFVATQTVLDAAHARRAQIEDLEREVQRLAASLHRAAHEELEEDRDLQWASSKIEFFLSEDTNTPELLWGLTELHKHWETLRADYERNIAHLGQLRPTAGPTSGSSSGGAQPQQAQQPAPHAAQNGAGPPTGVISGLLSRLGL